MKNTLTFTICGLIVMSAIMLPTGMQAQDLVRSFHMLAPSLVLIVKQDGKNTLGVGVGVIFSSSSKGSLIVTAAHVLVGKALKAPKPAEGISVYWLHQPDPSAKEHHPLASNLTVPPGNIDTDLDLAVIRVETPNLPVVCVAQNEPPAGTRIGIAAFSLQQIEGQSTVDWSNPETLDETWPSVREGIIGLSTRSGMEYYAPEEEGFSGGPIFDERTGLVFALVQKEADFSGRGSKATYVSTYGLAFDMLLSKFDPWFDVVLEPMRLGDSGRYRYPDLSRRGRLLILDMESRGTHKIRASESALESTLKNAVASYLGVYTDEMFELTEDEVGSRAGGSVNSGREAIDRNTYYQNLCAIHNTAGVLRVKRIYSGRLNEFVQYELSFDNCRGVSYKTVRTPQMLVPEEKAYFAKNQIELKNFSDSIGETLTSHGSDLSAIRNFMAYGIFLHNGEYRVFMNLSRTPVGAVVATNVLPEGAAQLGGLRDGDVIVSFNGVTADTLYFMTDDQLQALVASAEQERREFSIETTRTLGQGTIYVRPHDVCGYVSTENQLSNLIP